MTFPPRLLGDGEVVVVDARPHWWSLVRPVTVVVVVLAGAVAAYAYGAPAPVAWLLPAVLVVALAWLMARYARWATTSLVVTNRRIIHRQGVVARSRREIPLGQLTDISYRQTIFGRVIGAGDLVVRSAGSEGPEVFPRVPHPADIQSQIQRQLSEGRRVRGPELTIFEQIGMLDDLRRRGMITRAEFEAKKAELLQRM